MFLNLNNIKSKLASSPLHRGMETSLVLDSNEKTTTANQPTFRNVIALKPFLSKSPSLGCIEVEGFYSMQTPDALHVEMDMSRDYQSEKILKYPNIFNVLMNYSAVVTAAMPLYRAWTNNLWAIRLKDHRAEGVKRIAIFNTEEFEQLLEEGRFESIRNSAPEGHYLQQLNLATLYDDGQVVFSKEDDFYETFGKHSIQPNDSINLVEKAGLDWIIDLKVRCLTQEADGHLAEYLSVDPENVDEEDRVVYYHPIFFNFELPYKQGFSPVHAIPTDKVSDLVLTNYGYHYDSQQDNTKVFVADWSVETFGLNKKVEYAQIPQDGSKIWLDDNKKLWVARFKTELVLDWEKQLDSTSNSDRTDILDEEFGEAIDKLDVSALMKADLMQNLVKLHDQLSRDVEIGEVDQLDLSRIKDNPEAKELLLRYSNSILDIEEEVIIGFKEKIEGLSSTTKALISGDTTVLQDDGVDVNEILNIGKAELNSFITSMDDLVTEEGATGWESEMRNSLINGVKFELASIPGWTHDPFGAIARAFEKFKDYITKRQNLRKKLLGDLVQYDQINQVIQAIKDVSSKFKDAAIFAWDKAVELLKNAALKVATASAKTLVIVEPLYNVAELDEVPFFANKGFNFIRIQNKTYAVMPVQGKVKTFFENQGINTWRDASKTDQNLLWIEVDDRGEQWLTNIIKSKHDNISKYYSILALMAGIEKFGPTITPAQAATMAGLVTLATATAAGTAAANTPGLISKLIAAAVAAVAVITANAVYIGIQESKLHYKDMEISYNEKSKDSFTTIGAKFVNSPIKPSHFLNLNYYLRDLEIWNKIHYDSFELVDYSKLVMIPYTSTMLTLLKTLQVASIGVKLTAAAAVGAMLGQAAQKVRNSAKTRKLVKEGKKKGEFKVKTSDGKELKMSKAEMRAKVEFDHFIEQRPGIASSLPKQVLSSANEVASQAKEVASQGLASVKTSKSLSPRDLLEVITVVGQTRKQAEHNGDSIRKVQRDLRVV